MEQSNAKILSDIEQYGCHVLHILEEENWPRFTYSIGIEKTNNHPEIIVTGLRRDLAHSIINECHARIQAGETFEVENFYGDLIEGVDVTFRQVEPKHYTEYFGSAIWFYKSRNFRVLQLIYPSTSGIWPWEPDAPEAFKFFLPVLYAH
ncbi:MAG: DUF4262 domain-containing protein [Cyanobacteria bacterium J06642_11]